MSYVESNKKCDFGDILKLNSYLASQIFTKLQKIIAKIQIYILPCKLDLCATLNRTKSVILSIFWNFIHFWPSIFSLNLKKMLILSIFIFCLVNWTYIPRRIEQKV